MATDRLRKYLAYYRQTLDEEPDNVEARLRLAALFCEMGRRADAVRAYERAAHQLMEQGLAMEAIAACKAVLGLDPTHQETQLLMARLYARVPSATDEASRIARPLEERGAEEVEYFPVPEARGEVTQVQRSEESISLRMEAAKTDNSKGIDGAQLWESTFFSGLDEAVVEAVYGEFEEERYGAGQRIVAPGEAEANLYFLASGSAEVKKRQLDGRVIELAKLEEGEIFGEFQLLTGQGGWAEVVACEEVVLQVLSDDVVYELGRSYPGFWQALWTFYYQRMLNHAMASSEIFGGLSREERHLVAGHFQLCEYGAGQWLSRAREGADWLRVVVSGSVVEEDGHTQRVQGEWGPGSLLGVRACMEGEGGGRARRARTDVVVYEMAGEVFRQMVEGLDDVASGVRRQLSEARMPNWSDGLERSPASEFL